MMQDVHVKLYPGLPWQKQHSIRRLFNQRIGFELRENVVKCYIWSIACMVLKFGHFAKYIRNTCKGFLSMVLKKNGEQLDLSF